MRYSNHLPNQPVEANRRPAAPLEAGSQFGAPFCVPPVLPAAVAHLGRSLHAGKAITDWRR